MTEPIEIKNCEDDDILSFNDEICKVKKFKEATSNYFESYNTNSYINYISEQLKISELNVRESQNFRYRCNDEWFKTGKQCGLLKEGKRWRKGKLRIKLTLEFIPNEPEVSEENSDHEIDNIVESPLDEIRQQLTEECNS